MSEDAPNGQAIARDAPVYRVIVREGPNLQPLALAFDEALWLAVSTDIEVAAP